MKERSRLITCVTVLPFIILTMHYVKFQGAETFYLFIVVPTLILSLLFWSFAIPYRYYQDLEKLQTEKGGLTWLSVDSGSAENLRHMSDHPGWTFSPSSSLCQEHCL